MKVTITDVSPDNASRSALKVAITALVGSSIQWYDFFLYGTAAALVFPTEFFSKELPPLVALVAAFSTFAVGFIARPVGGILFGHFGDRRGRKSALVAALAMMGIATTLIGCLPTYATAGVWAPLMLVFLRFMQGLAIGGQWGGVVLLATESAPKHLRGFYGSFAQVGVPIGVVFANLSFLLASTTLPQAAFMSWGWRVPFLASVTLIALASYVQLRIEDTAAFRQLLALKQQREQETVRRLAATRGVTFEMAAAELAAERRPSPVMEALKRYPKQIVLAAGAFMAVQVVFYILTVFVVAYGTNPAGLNVPRNTILFAVLIASMVMVPATIVSGAISDRLGRRGIYMAGALLLGVWGFIMFSLIETGSFFWIVVAIGMGQVFVAMMYGPQAAFFAEMFTTKMRYSGASLGYQLGAILGGALAPLIATALLAQFGSTFAISVYIAIACAITLASVLVLRETYQTDMRESDEPATPSQHRAGEAVPS